MIIRYVSLGDKSFWLSIDKHFEESEFDKKVRDKQGYVLLVDEKPVGLLRYNLSSEQRQSMPVVIFLAGDG